MPQEKGGRPRFYDDPIFFEERVNQYFDFCEANGKPPVIASLCLHLGFSDRNSFARYEEYEGFSSTVKRAKLRIEAARNEMLFNRDHATAGVIFDLKNNHGWTDRVETTEMTPSDFGREVERFRKEMERATVNQDEDDDAEMV